MDIHTAALSLLLLRLLSMGFIIRVLTIQHPLLKAENDPQVKPIRYILFGTALAVFVGNLVPILVDVITLFADIDRTRQLSPVSIAYAFSNATTSVLFAFGLWLMYRITAVITSQLKDENSSLQQENDDLHKRDI